MAVKKTETKTSSAKDCSAKASKMNKKTEKACGSKSSKAKDCGSK